MDYLEDLEVWQPAFSTRLKGALDSNSQVSDAWGVPDRIKTLTKKWSSRGV